MTFKTKFRNKHAVLFSMLIFFLALLAFGLISVVVLVKTRTMPFGVAGCLLAAGLFMAAVILRVLVHEARKLFGVKCIVFDDDMSAHVAMKSGITHRFSGAEDITIMHNRSDGSYALDLKGKTASFYIKQLDMEAPEEFSMWLRRVAGAHVHLRQGLRSGDHQERLEETARHLRDSSRRQLDLAKEAGLGK